MSITIIQFLKHFKDETFWYIKKNKYPLIFLSFCVLMAAINILYILGIDIKSNESWEFWAIFATIVYAVYLHLYMLWNGHFEVLGGNYTFYTFLCNLPLFLLLIILGADHFGLININLSRLHTLLLLILSSIVYTFLNWVLYLGFNSKANKLSNEMDKAFYKDLSERFYSTVFSSEIPLNISFCFLLLFYVGIKYAVYLNIYPEFIQSNTLLFDSILNNNDINEEALSNVSINMEIAMIQNYDKILNYFISGAIALQMMFSNAVWVFSDDKILEKAPSLREENTNDK